MTIATALLQCERTPLKVPGSNGQVPETNAQITAKINRVHGKEPPFPPKDTHLCHSERQIPTCVTQRDRDMHTGEATVRDMHNDLEYSGFIFVHDECGDFLTLHGKQKKLMIMQKWDSRTRKHRKRHGDSRESNPGPLAPEARIIPLDHYPRC